MTTLDNGRYWRSAAIDRTFGYLWEPTRTVGLKQTILEQLALVAERPVTRAGAGEPRREPPARGRVDG